MPTDFLSVLQGLNDAQVRYVLVGGLAVLLHGVDRLTADIDRGPRREGTLAIGIRYAGVERLGPGKPASHG